MSVTVRCGEEAVRRAAGVNLIDRSHLDGRTIVARRFDNTVADIAEDLGGADYLSIVQRTLIEAYAGAVAGHMNAQLLLGQPVNLAEYSQAFSLMARIAARLGITRQPCDVTGNSQMLTDRKIERVIIDVAADGETAQEASDEAELGAVP
jgi:hypothetical protein